MISKPGHLQHTSSNQLDSSAEAQQCERLALLVARASSPAADTLQEYALAYVERFQGNVLQLEHEWDFLAAALYSAWQDEQYEVVVRLASALAYPAGRRTHFAEAKRLLQTGIVASRRVQDQWHFASLLNRLGGLTFTHGRYSQGYRLWHTGLYALEAAGSSPGLWEPLSSFAQIADVLGNYASAHDFLETFYSQRQIDKPDGLAVALFVRGLYARFMSKLDEAYEDFSHSVRLLVPQIAGETLSPARQLFLVVVQAEMARTQRNYARAQQYTETALALAQAFGDSYTFATLLVDQGMFAWQQGWYDEIRRVFPRLREIESQAMFPNVAEINRLLAEQLFEQGIPLPEPQSSIALTAPSLSPSDVLSEREREVLQLVAEGLTSREIAARLVITTATVKKHLEHIYTRLDVHNRASAILQGRKLNLVT